MPERTISENPGSNRDPDRRKNHQGFNTAAMRLTLHRESEVQSDKAAKHCAERRSADRSG